MILPLSYEGLITSDKLTLASPTELILVGKVNSSHLTI